LIQLKYFIYAPLATTDLHLKDAKRD
jgi:hypothetical protein